MESMLKYLLFIIMLALANASTAKEAHYTGRKGAPKRDPVCKSKDPGYPNTATVPQDIWTGTERGCVYAKVSCADSKSCKPNSIATVLVVGGESGNGNTFTISGDAFKAIAKHGASKIGIVYIP